MSKLKPTPCINCSEIPTVFENENDDYEEYKYLLKHQYRECYPSYKLMVYDDTVEGCIKSWNEFNVMKRGVCDV